MQTRVMGPEVLGEPGLQATGQDLGGVLEAAAVVLVHDVADLVEQALALLQGSLSLKPENNDLVVSLLSGQTVVIPWKFSDLNRTFYFPFPRVKNAAEFKAAASKLGKPGGQQVPVQDTDVATRQYQSALKAFQNMVNGMRDLGFETLLDNRWLSPIIVTFFCPADPKFVFDRFYELMKDKGFIIYPGKLTVVDSFRVGCIGQMDEHVMQQVVAAARDTLREMGVSSATPPDAALQERAKLAS